MKRKADLVRAWLRKAEDDEVAMNASFHAGALGPDCFHAQQVAEKYLKAFLVHSEIPFPYTHNLSKLLRICSQLDKDFLLLVPSAELLTPYAIDARYEPDFLPKRKSARQAIADALAIKAFVLQRLPKRRT